MTDRKVLQRHHVFVKKELTDNKQWTVDLGLSFQPDEMHLRNVAFSNQRERKAEADGIETVVLRGMPNWMATLYMENIGDICTLTESVNRTTNYVFDVKRALSFARFELRHIDGSLADIDAEDPAIPSARLIAHLEFIKYESSLVH